MQVEEDETGFIEIRDQDKWGDVLAKITLKNNTYPPSVASRSNSIYIKFDAKPRRKSLIYMEIVTSPCKYYNFF